MLSFVLRCYRTAVAFPVPSVGRVVRRAIRRHLAVGHVAARVIWHGSILTCVLVPVAIGATLLPDLPPVVPEARFQHDVDTAGPGAGPGGQLRDFGPPGGGESLFFPPSPAGSLEPLLRDMGAAPLQPAPGGPPPSGGGGGIPPRPIPEPPAWLLFGLAVLSAVGLRRARRPPDEAYNLRAAGNPD